MTFKSTCTNTYRYKAIGIASLRMATFNTQSNIDVIRMLIRACDIEHYLLYLPDLLKSSRLIRGLKGSS